MAVAVGLAGSYLGIAEAAVHADVLRRARPETASFTAGPAPRTLQVQHTVWEGADLDGDGQPDIANPTGQATRG